MNILFFNTDTMQKTVNSRTVSTGQKGAQKALTTALRYVNLMKKHTAIKQNIKTLET